jgi:phosphoribosylamine--glycine ligase
MKLLVIGSGGREHALVWKLAQSPHVTQLWCAPGNAGIAGEHTLAARKPVECVEVSAEDLPKMLAFALEKKPDLTVVGPDNPLALGIVDLFEQKGLRIWGPNKRAAQFEAFQRARLLQAGSDARRPEDDIPSMIALKVGLGRMARSAMSSSG